MDGQHARLRGIVEDEADIASAREAAMTAAGAGGAWAGGVTSVDSEDVRVGAFDRRYAWSARRVEERGTLLGAAPIKVTRSSSRRALHA
jgi:hypothetical protein